MKRKLRSEGLTYLPPALALRRRGGTWPRGGPPGDIRGQGAADHRGRQRADPRANRRGAGDPAVLLAPYDVDGVVERWRQRRSVAGVRQRDGVGACREAELAGRVGRGEVHRLGDVGLLRDDGGPGEGGHDAVRERRVGLGDQLLVALSGVGGEACRRAVARLDQLDAHVERVELRASDAVKPSMAILLAV